MWLPGSLLQQRPKSSMDLVLGREGRCEDWGEGVDTFLSLNDSSPMSGLIKSSDFWRRTGNHFPLCFWSAGGAVFYHVPLAVLAWSPCFVCVFLSCGAAGGSRLRGGELSSWKEPLS